MKYTFVLCLLLSFSHCISQTLSEEDRFMDRLNAGEVAPTGLLATRSAFLFSADYAQPELEKIQKAFQQTGIDAVVYLESDRVVAGIDLQNAYAIRFTRRNVRFLIFARKKKQEYEFWFLPFHPKTSWTKPGQSAWRVHSANLQDLLTSIFRTLVSTQKRQNFLINDFPEQEEIFSLFVNNRNEAMVSNLKAFKVAVPRMGDKTSDQELAQYFKENFRGKYEMVEDTLSEKDLVQKGFRYVLRYVHAPGSVAKEILGYDRSKSESALASLTYSNGALQLKTIPSPTIIYKFYLKDLEDKGLYLGAKWDADITWQDALKNHLDGYRFNGRIN